MRCHQPTYAPSCSSPLRLCLRWEADDHLGPPTQESASFWFVKDCSCNRGGFQSLSIISLSWGQTFYKIVMRAYLQRKNLPCNQLILTLDPHQLLFSWVEVKWLGLEFNCDHRVWLMKGDLALCWAWSVWLSGMTARNRMCGDVWFATRWNFN